METQEQQELSDKYRSEARACGVPEHLVGGLVLYLVHGIAPGSCVTAILANDLLEALGRADHNTAAKMKQICTFIYSYTPSESHGSYDRVEKWMRKIHEKAEAAV